VKKLSALLKSKVAALRKFAAVAKKACVPLVTAVVGVLAELSTLGVGKGTPAAISTAIVGLATALGVWKAKNAPSA
jgi:hypothetical protein